MNSMITWSIRSPCHCPMRAKCRCESCMPKLKLFKVRYVEQHFQFRYGVKQTVTMGTLFVKRIIYIIYPIYRHKITIYIIYPLYRHKRTIYIIYPLYRHKRIIYIIYPLYTCRHKRGPIIGMCECVSYLAS